jgi:hypothetical protein
MQLGTDQARAAFLAIHKADGGGIAELGIPSSLGVLHRPGFLWLLAPGAALTADPVALTALAALLGTAPVALIYLRAREAAAPLGPWRADGDHRLTCRLLQQRVAAVVCDNPAAAKHLEGSDGGRSLLGHVVR